MSQEVCIVDSENRLSKAQKSRIKTLYKEGTSLDEILDKIHYQEGIKKRYHGIKKVEKAENSISLEFYDDESGTGNEKEDLKKRLHDKLVAKEMKRSQNYKNEAWRMYYQMLEHPMIKSLPDQTIKLAVPTPDGVKEKADHYRRINKLNPNAIIQQYIQTCLDCV